MNFSEAILSLGSNQGDRFAWLGRARDALALYSRTYGTAADAPAAGPDPRDGPPPIRILECSPVYETEPVDVPATFAGQLYLNQVVIVETALDAAAFSDAVHAVERRLGRTRGPLPNLPRTIDIDIVAFGGLRSDAPDLTLPHPRARARRFVLQPLADLRPGFVLPGETRTVSELLLSLPPAPRVTRLT
jgi:2-amino-4-hydroxy-6-hydroxymethyldihydropteridine diphosphokinase